MNDLEREEARKCVVCCESLTHGGDGINFYRHVGCGIKGIAFVKAIPIPYKDLGFK